MDFIYSDAVWDRPEALADIHCRNPQRVKYGQQGYAMNEAEIKAMREQLNPTQRFVFDAIMQEVEPDQTDAHNHTPRRYFDKVRDGCHRRFRLYRLDYAEGCEPGTHATGYAWGVLSAMLIKAEDVMAECGGDEQEIRNLFTHYVYKTAERELMHRKCLVNFEELDGVAQVNEDPEKNEQERKPTQDPWTRLERFFTELERFFTERGCEREFHYLRAAFTLLPVLKRFEQNAGDERVPHGTHQILADALLISPENSRTLMKNTVRVYEEFVRTYYGG